MLTVRGLQFSVFRANDILKLSVAQIKQNRVSDKSKPMTDGLNDLRLGSSDPRFRCETCGAQGLSLCPGHYGHYFLATPVYLIQHVRLIIGVLNQICSSCHSLRASSTRCDSCGPLSLYKYNSQKLIIDATSGQGLPAHEAYDILNAISKETYSCIDYNDLENRHPRDYICYVLCIPPPCIRPAVSIRDNSQIQGQDDLTSHLGNIIKFSESILSLLPHDEQQALRAKFDVCTRRAQVDTSLYVHLPDNAVFRKARDQLQLSITGYINNTKLKDPIKRRGGNMLKSVLPKLAGKTGRFRNEMARTVIIPALSGDIDEVELPVYIAKTVTIPIRVNELNQKQLTEIVRRGPTPSDMFATGANSIILPNGTRVDIGVKEQYKVIRIVPGMTVERHIQNGDSVVLNRQPSLHTHNLLAHRVRLSPNKAMGVALSLMIGYAGDFDGDEMTLHAPQTLEARAEVETLMAANTNLLNLQNSTPIVVLTQDALLAAYLMTKENPKLLSQLALNACLECIHYPTHDRQMKRGDRSVGLLSYLFPTNLNYEFDGLVIRDGQVTKGVLTTNHVGKQGGHLLAHINTHYGKSALFRFISDACRLLNMWMSHRGFSVTWRDCIEQGSVSQEHTAKLRVLTGRIHELFGNNIPTNAELLLQRAQQRLPVDQPSNAENNITLMIASGSKGNSVNYRQIRTAVGQQYINEARISECALPYFKHRSDEHLERKGYITSSFAKGLNPQEFWFHAMAGREGLLDTSTKTSETGTLQRYLTFTMQDARVAYDRTVRNHRSQIIQFRYGGDGLSADSLSAVIIDGKRVRVPACLIPTYMDNGQLGPHFEEQLESITTNLGTRMTDAIKSIARGTGEYLARAKAGLLRAEVQPGTMVGTLAAQSIGGPTTQMTLRTFHHSGQKDADGTSTINRIKELMMCKCKDVVIKCQAKTPLIKQTKISDLVQRVSYPRINLCEYVIQMTLRERVELWQREAMANSLSALGDVQFVFDGQHARLFALRLRPENNKYDDELVALQSVVEFYENNLLDRVIHGKPGILRVSFDPKSQWNSIRLDSSRAKLSTLRADVDIIGETVFSNDVMKMQQLYGLEFALRLLRDELVDTMNAGGVDVDERHVMLLADVMGASGQIEPCCSKVSDDVINNAMLNESIDTVTTAAANYRRDNLDSVTSQLAAGVRMNGGTGLCGVQTRSVVDQLIFEYKKTLGSIGRVVNSHTESKSEPEYDRKLYQPRGSPIDDATDSPYDPAIGPGIALGDELQYDPTRSPSIEGELRYDPTKSPCIEGDELRYDPTMSPPIEGEELQYDPTLSPLLLPQSPTYTPQSPTYAPQSPEFIPRVDSSSYPSFSSTHDMSEFDHHGTHSINPWHDLKQPKAYSESDMQFPVPDPDILQSLVVELERHPTQTQSILHFQGNPMHKVQIPIQGRPLQRPRSPIIN